LSAGHSLLFELLHSGIPLEQATKLLQFKFGTGSTYFYEIAKYRVFRKLWSTIIAAYQPSNQESYHTVLSAVSGSMNKSLKDPYTNLLRQTTEAMSAVIGGVDSILILPYDHHSLNGPTTLAERMALNISLILKEESFMDKVNDATGGAYAIEQLTQLFSDKSWELFRILENKGGLFQTPTMDYLRVQVTSTAKKRKEAIQSGSKVVIGINKFPNPEQLSPEFKEENTFHGLSKLSYEQITLTTLSSK
jgi:methylmalonyl-CoA mutase